jgi:hypothetical protein
MQLRAEDVVLSKLRLKSAAGLKAPFGIFE